MMTCSECSSSCLFFSCKAGWKAGLYARVAVATVKSCNPLGPKSPTIGFDQFVVSLVICKFHLTHLTHRLICPCLQASFWTPRCCQATLL